MDYREFKKAEESRSSVFEEYVAKPFLYGLTFGVGYYLAVTLIQHPWSMDLLDFARSETLKKAALKGAKEASSAASQTPEVMTAVRQSA